MIASIADKEVSSSSTVSGVLPQSACYMAPAPSLQCISGSTQSEAQLHLLCSQSSACRIQKNSTAALRDSRQS